MPRRQIAVTLLVGLLIAFSPARGAAPDGASTPPADTAAPGRALFAEHCAACHEGGVQRAPHREFLQGMSPSAILMAMSSGVMQRQAAPLTPAQRQQVAKYLTGRDLAHYQPPPPPMMCTGAARAFDLAKPAEPVGWGHDNRRFVPDAAAGFTARDVPHLKLKWAFDFPESLRARSQPAIALGAVFVGSQSGNVYALDLKSGCVRWINQGSAEVRITLEEWLRRIPEFSIAPGTTLTYRGGLVGAVNALPLVWPVAAHDVEHPSNAGAE